MWKRNARTYSRKSGVTRIVRETYNTVNGYSQKAAWWSIRKEVLVRDGEKCVQCSSKDSLEVHHIVPLSRGGTTTKANLITLCSGCHDKRHGHLHSKRFRKTA